MVDEIREYLASEQQKHPEYFQAITDVLAQLPQAAPGVSVFVLVPVHSSERDIRHLLVQYEKQTMDKGSFEVLLFLNRREGDPSLDRVRADVVEFQKTNSVRVFYFEWTFSQKAPIGLLRKILNDVALARVFGAETLLVNNDADALDIGQRYLDDTFALHQGQTLLTTQSQHYLDAVYKAPSFGDLVRFVESLESAYGLDVSPDAFVSAWCGNFVLNANSYARIGGFDPSAWIGEELVLTHFFVKKFGLQSFLRTRPDIITSCRRIAHGFLRNIPAVSAYSDFFTADIRHKSEHEILDSVRHAAQGGATVDIAKRAGEEFLFYLQKLSVLSVGPSATTLERRFFICLDIFSGVCEKVGIDLSVAETESDWCATFTKGENKYEIVVKKKK